MEPLEGRQLLSAALPGTTHVTDATPVGIVPVSVTLHEKVAKSFTAVVGRVKGISFSEIYFYSVGSSINWGDSTVAGKPDITGGIATYNGTYSVTGTHTYATPGLFQVTVTVVARSLTPGDPTSKTLAVVHSSAEVAGGVSIVEPDYTKVTPSLGTFVYKNVDLSLMATINWGDGSSTPGKITREGTTLDFWSVTGTHEYKKVGKFKVIITVTGRPVGSPASKLVTPIATVDSTIQVLPKV
jgi:hypothetical protein